MVGSQRLLHHRQYLRPPRLRFQALVCTGDAGGAGLWQCVSMMPYAPKTGWTGDVPAKKNGQTNKIHLSIRFGGASGSRTLAPVSRPIAFRVRPLTTTWVMLQILNFRMLRAFWENFGENFRRERPKIVHSRSRKTRMKPSKIGNPLPKSQLDFESRLFDHLSTTPCCISRENCKLYIADFLLNLRNLMLEYC